MKKKEIPHYASFVGFVRNDIITIIVEGRSGEAH
jgi:hypothetical protein